MHRDLLLSVEDGWQDLPIRVMRKVKKQGGCHASCSVANLVKTRVHRDLLLSVEDGWQDLPIRVMKKVKKQGGCHASCCTCGQILFFFMTGKSYDLSI